MFLLVCLFSSLIALLLFAMAEERGKNTRFARQNFVNQDKNLMVGIITLKEYSV